MKNFKIKDALVALAILPGMEIYRVIKGKRLNVDNMVQELIDKYDVRDVIEEVKYDDILVLGSDLIGAFVIPNNPFNKKGTLHIQTLKFGIANLQIDIELIAVTLHEIRHAQQYKTGTFNIKRYNKDIERIGRTTAAYMEIPEEKDAIEFTDKELLKNLKYLVK